MCKKKGTELTKEEFKKIKVYNGLLRGGSSKKQESGLEMCASRIPTRAEIKIDSKIEERVSHLNMKLRELSKDFVDYNKLLYNAKSDRNKAGREASNTKIFLESCEFEINDPNSDAGIRAVMVEMKNYNL